MTGRSGRDKKVLLSIFGPIAVLFIILAFVQYRTLAVNKDRVEDHLGRQQELITRLAVTGMHNSIAGVIQRLEQLGLAVAGSKDPSVRSEEVGKAYEALRDRVNAVACFDASGRKLDSVSDGDAQGELPADCRFEEFFTAPRLTMVPYLSPLTRLPDGRMVVYVACPVRASGTGAFEGITLAQLDRVKLSNLCNMVKGLNEETSLFFYDQRGQCICPVSGPGPDVKPFVDEMAAGGEVSTTVDFDGTSSSGGGASIHMHPIQVAGYTWYTASLMPLSVLNKIARDDFYRLFIVGAFFIIALSGGGVYFLSVHKAKEQAELEAGYNAALSARSADLADEREKLLAVINSIPDGLMLLDGDGRVLVANSRIKDILGVLPGGRLDSGLSGLPDDFPLRPLLGPAGTGEATIGSKTYQVMSISVGDSGQGRLREIRVLRDITAERSLAQKKADLVSMITHDVKSPLSAIIGLSEWISEETDGWDCATEEVRSGISAISRASARILAIMENFLFLSSIEGMRKLNREDVDLDLFISKALLEFQHEAKNSGIKLEICLTEPLPAVYMDETQMARAVANLISNALKYTPKGGTVTVGAKNFRDYVTISVSDTGQGIGKQDIPLVFDRYYRAKSSVSGVKGSGLGLAIAKAVVEAHGGTIDVDSTEGKGAVFTLRLPLLAKGGEDA